MKTLLATALALSLPALAAAHDYTLGDLEIIHPRIFATAATAKTGGGYLTIANIGDEADALIGVSGGAPKVQIHQSFEENGVMKMRHLDRLEIGADDVVDLVPGGYHLMFMGLTKPFVAGTDVPVTLTFEKAGKITVDFQVVERDGGMNDHEMDNSASE